METENQTTVLGSKEELGREGQNGNSEQLIVFKLGNEEYALPIDQIKEVVLTPRISKIPQTPDYIKGVANIRGNVISILDLEERFGLLTSAGNGKAGDDEVEAEESSNYTLVIESEEYKIGILVKEVPNTLSVNPAEIDSTSNIVQHSSLDENAINGIVKLEDRMIILIDILKMMEAGNIRTAQTNGSLS